MKTFKQILEEVVGDSISESETIPFDTANKAAIIYASRWLDEAAKRATTKQQRTDLENQITVVDVSSILALKSQLK